MRFRLMLVGAATVAVVAAGAAPALAGSVPPAPHTPKLATIGCQVTPGCVEPVFAVSATSGTAFVPADDEAMTARTSDQSVQVRQNNGLDNGRQDWNAQIDTTVPLSGPGDYGFTTFDNQHYAGDLVVHFEWTPFGQDTGRCLHVTRVGNGVLRDCTGGARQEFILARNGLGIPAPFSIAYRYALNVLHVANLQRHLCLTGRDNPPGQVTAQRCIAHSFFAATRQMISFLP